MTVRLKSSGVANVTKGGRTSKDVRILTLTDRGSSSFVHGKIVCGLSGATRDLASVVGGLRSALGTSVKGICMNVKKRSLHAVHGARMHRLRRRAGVSRRLVSSVVSDGHRIPVVSRRVLRITPRRCGMNVGLLTSPMKIPDSRVRKHFLGVVTHDDIGRGVSGYFGRTKVRVTSCVVSPLTLTGTMLAGDRGHSNYVFVSFNTSAAAMSICGGGVLHRLTIVPLKKDGVAGSVYDRRVRRRSTRRLGGGCNGTCTSGSRSKSSGPACSLSKGYDVRSRLLRSVMRTHIGRVLTGM